MKYNQNLKTDSDADIERKKLARDVGNSVGVNLLAIIAFLFFGYFFIQTISSGLNPKTSIDRATEDLERLAR